MNNFGAEDHRKTVHKVVNDRWSVDSGHTVRPDRVEGELGDIEWFVDDICRGEAYSGTLPRFVDVQKSFDLRQTFLQQVSSLSVHMPILMRFF